MQPEMHHLDIKVFGNLELSVDAYLRPADVSAIQRNPEMAARYAATVAINTLASAQKNNPSWTAEQMGAVAVETAACTIAAVLAM